VATELLERREPVVDLELDDFDFLSVLALALDTALDLDGLEELLGIRAYLVGWQQLVFGTREVEEQPQVPEGHCRNLAQNVVSLDLQTRRAFVHILRELAGIQIGDIILDTTDGRQLSLRRVARPNAEQKRILTALKLELPERLSPDRLL
jgi:hypothetical protein